MIYLLIAVYALLMGTAACIKHKELGLTLTAVNLLGSLVLLCTPLHLGLLPIGLILLLGCALRNGLRLQGHIRALHVLVRLVISLSLFIGYICL